MHSTTQISLTENHIAVLFQGRWEIYEVIDGLEMFSHYAGPAETLQINAAAAPRVGQLVLPGVAA